MSIKNIFGGAFMGKIVTNIVFGYIKLISFCVFLLVVLISVRYNSNYQVMKINSLHKEVIALKQNALKHKTIYQNSISMHSISQRLSQRGILPSKEPVKDIIIIK